MYKKLNTSTKEYYECSFSTFSGVAVDVTIGTEEGLSTATARSKARREERIEEE
ncbi:MAG: hypothetical protein ACRC3G_02560 [Bacteroidales bacterium]